MVPLHTRVKATITGSFDYLKAPESLTNYARHAIAKDGTVINLAVATTLFSDQWTATVEYITSDDHDSLTTIRTLIADAFATWNGLPVTVAITEPASGDSAPAAPKSPFTPPTGLLWLVYGVIALVVVVNVAPLLKGRP